MKKIIAMLLSATLLVGMLTACGQTGTPSSEDTSSSVQDTKGPEGELSAILDKIYAEKDPGLKVITSPVDLTNAESLKYMTGLTGADKVKEAAVSESMIGSQAYSVVLVRVKDSADAGEVAAAMKEGIDTRKWICVEADDLRVAACGDVIMLAMVSTDLSEAVTAGQLVDAFTTVCGGTLALDLK